MIKEFFYYNPVKLVFGEGKLQEAGKYALLYGKKALIVTTGTMFKESGLVDRLQKILKASGVSSVYYPEVSANPLNTQIDKGAEIARAANCKLVIGLGGGSAIDAAKGIAIVLGHKRPIWDFCIGAEVQPITDKTYPIIAITTTSVYLNRPVAGGATCQSSCGGKAGQVCCETLSNQALTAPRTCASCAVSIAAGTPLASKCTAPA